MPRADQIEFNDSGQSRSARGRWRFQAAVGPFLARLRKRISEMPQ
jgi:hypothetical protein